MSGKTIKSTYKIYTVHVLLVAVTMYTPDSTPRWGLALQNPWLQVGLLVDYSILVSADYEEGINMRVG